jgi:hypothetical protein
MEDDSGAGLVQPSLQQPTTCIKKQRRVEVSLNPAKRRSHGAKK